MIMNGKNVSIRPIRLTDANILCKWKNDEETYMYLGGGFQPVSEDQYVKWVENMIDQTGNNRRFIIENDNGAIGMIGLYDINWIHRTCEVGAFIGEKAEKCKGAATEAYCLIEAFAKNYLNLRKIKLNVVADNTTAVKFWLKQGFCSCGTLTDERFINGRYCDLAIMEKFI